MMKSLLRIRKTFLLFLAALFLSNFALAQMPEGNAENGESLFKSKCATCHLVNDRLVGPALKGALNRWDGDFAKLADFIAKGAGAYANDPYVSRLISEYGTMMPGQGLNEQQVADVFAFVEAGTTEGPGGDGAQAISYAPVPQDNSLLRYLFIGIVILLIVIIYLSFRIYGSFRKDRDFEDPHGRGLSWSKANAFIFPLFLILFFGGIIYETIIHTTPEFMRPEAASETGVEIDKLFRNTTIVTLIVFIVTQILLFWYAFRYRYNPKRKGYFYPHNNTIEFIWTIVPALVLSFLVLDGFKTWRHATDKPEGKTLEVEAFARQFDWTFRYPGPDGKLGKVDFRKISGTNPLGLDFSDPNAQDDILTDTLFLPVHTDVYMRLRSQDVLHAAYLVHFRAQLYAQPGMDNRMRFKPIFTTQEMRDKTRNPEFNYELACNQLCGASHYNMRRVVVVDQEEAYRNWIKNHNAFYKKDMQAMNNETPAN